MNTILCHTFDNWYFIHDRSEVSHMTTSGDGCKFAITDTKALLGADLNAPPYSSSV